ncbi:MAG: glycoside hydrolase family 127 protein [Microbacterium enclense]
MTVTTPPLAQPLAPVVPSKGILTPLGLNEVRITGGFWGERQDTNARNTLTHIFGRLESEGWLPNFDRGSAGTLPTGRRGREFSDSEVFKYLEAVAWEIGRSDDPALERTFRGVVARVAAAQEADGYLNTKFGRLGQEPRWSDLEWGHELYCLGHLFQAAVARERTRPNSDDGLLDVARRAADLVYTVFGPDGRNAVCGHPEIEVGLAELARVTGEERYLEQARLFIDRRGHRTLNDIEWGRSYFQDEIPVRDTTVLHGHAVRANYLAAGAVDIAVENDDASLLDTLRQQWGNTVARRTYITGGQGSHHQDEAFGEDWELPPDRAYSETCAGIGSIMFSWRLLLAEGDARYADLIERTLYNVVATSPSEDGRAFYYSNTLHQRVPGAPADPEETSLRASSSLRAPWFEVSCCPPYVARTFATLGTYIATADDNGVQIHQYAPSEIRTTLSNGQDIALNIETDYPRSGTVRIRVMKDSARPWTLSLRVPAWAEGTSIKVNGHEQTANPGMAAVRRAFNAGDIVELSLPMIPQIRSADSRIDAIRGCVAIERGPEVYALESIDTGDADFTSIHIDLTGGIHERDGKLWITAAEQPAKDSPWPYKLSGAQAKEQVGEVALIQYHNWAQRGPTRMRVWIPTE